MIGYAEAEIFSADELGLYRRAVELIRIVPYRMHGELVRCHELARAVGGELGLPFQDGKFGFVEHTWLWTKPLDADALLLPILTPNILDVYVPGMVPQVALIHMASSLPTRYSLAWQSDLVIEEQVVRELREMFRRYETELTGREL